MFCRDESVINQSETLAEEEMQNMFSEMLVKPMSKSRLMAQAQTHMKEMFEEYSNNVDDEEVAGIFKLLLNYCSVLLQMATTAVVLLKHFCLRPWLRVK